jgi:peptidoglycan/xylan/chitin deacetylase (PgdA/CDA1 family)
MIRHVKGAVLRGTRSLGLNARAGESAWRRRRLLILCYHGVSLHDEHEWNPSLFISSATLSRRLELLHRNRCTVLPLGEAIERVYRNELPERAVCLTFDDGYHDFAAQAQPRLRQFGFPATVYLNTLRCGHDFPAVRIGLSYVLWKSRRPVIDGRGLPGLDQREYSLATAAARWTLAVAIHDIVRGSDLASQDEVLREVSRRVGVDYDALAATRMLTLMRPAEVTALAAEGVDFQMHTHRHSSPVESDRFLEEIRENRRRIEAMTQVTPTHFCYPSGVYRQSYFPLLESEGVVTATTTEAGLVTSDAAPLLLPRFVDMTAVSEAEFEGWLTGVAPWLGDVVRRPAQ